MNILTYIHTYTYKYTGKDHYFNFLTALSTSHPDMVFVIKNVKLFDEGREGRQIRFKMFFTGMFMCMCICMYLCIYMYIYIH
jgi:hypothetical protein